MLVRRCCSSEGGGRGAFYPPRIAVPGCKFNPFPLIIGELLIVAVVIGKENRHSTRDGARWSAVEFSLLQQTE